MYNKHYQDILYYAHIVMNSERNSDLVRGKVKIDPIKKILP